MTYRELYETGRKKLAEAGIEEADLDARLLLEHICHTNRNDLLVHGEREISAGDQLQYESFLAKRAERIPLQHLTGTQEFMGLQFSVNENVLIPRQDTEILVEEVMRQMQDGIRILDLCTGSGCILLSLLHYSNGCEGLGVDISAEALEVARKNAGDLQITADFLQSDLFEKVEGKFDFIISNPPYICTRTIDELMPEVREHEPRLALDGKEDGLYFYRRIIGESREYLVRGGWLFFEIGYDQGEAVKRMMEEHGFHGVEIRKDFAGLDRVVLGTYFPSVSGTVE